MNKSQGAYAVGVDFGGTKLLGLLVDPDGNVVAEHRVPTPYEAEPLLDAVAEVVERLEGQAGFPAIGLGLGAAGLVDRKGVLHFGPNVGGITGIAVQAGMEKRLPGYLIRVDNDANCATWGECLLGAGQRKREMVLVTLGTGIGAGMVTAGKLFRGENGFAAEFGHMTVDRFGVLCACGRNGCWEAYASGRALGRLGREAAAAGASPQLLELAGGNADNIRGEHVTLAARGGDKAALSVMGVFAEWLAVGIANIVAILDPEVVVIGGGLAEVSDLYLERTQEQLQEATFGSENRPEVPVLVAALGEQAGAVGAAMLVHGSEIPSL